MRQKSRLKALRIIAAFAVFLLLSQISITLAGPDEDSCNNAPQLTAVSGDDVLELIRDHEDGPILLNIWATWCQPCREEMPELLRLNEEYQDAGLRLILVSCDFTRHSDKAAEFLGSLGVTFETYIKEQSDNEFVNQIDPDWTGALPYSVLIDTDGNVLKTWEGKLNFAEVNALLRQLD